MAVVGFRSGTKMIEAQPSPAQLLSTDWKTWLTEGFAYFGVVFGGLGIFMLWNRLAFGTVSPVSGQIKRWWGSLDGNVYGGSASNHLTFFGIDYRGEGNAWHPVSTLLGKWADRLYGMGTTDIERYLALLLLVALAFYFILWINRHRARNAIVQLGIIPLFCGAWIQVISYHITGYSAFKEWYWISQLLIVVLVSVLIGGMINEVVRKYVSSQTVLWVAVLGAGLLMGASHWSYIRHTMPYGKAAIDGPYNDIAAFLEQNTEPGSMIGMTGGGNAGYFISDRTVINMDGLINSYEYFQLLKDREAGAYLADIGMDYVLANTGLIDQLPYNGQFAPYTEWMDIRYGGKDLVRYHPMPQQ